MLNYLDAAMSYQYLFFSLLTATLLCNVLGDEPQCSKFDFEEKLLEKVVRMEFQMDRLKSEITERDRQATEMAEKISALQKLIHVASNQEKTTDRLTDNVRKKKKLQFRAVRKTELTSLKTDDIIKFPEVLHNTGAYDPLTGVFTATTNDTYVFTVRLCPKHRNYLVIAVMVDGIEQDVFALYPYRETSCSTAETVLILEEDQKIWLQIKYARNSSRIVGDQYGWNTFSGRVL